MQKVYLVKKVASGEVVGVSVSVADQYICHVFQPGEDATKEGALAGAKENSMPDFLVQLMGDDLETFLANGEAKVGVPVELEYIEDISAEAA